MLVNLVNMSKTSEWLSFSLEAAAMTSLLDPTSNFVHHSTAEEKSKDPPIKENAFASKKVQPCSVSQQGIGGSYDFEEGQGREFSFIFQRLFCYFFNSERVDKN